MTRLDIIKNELFKDVPTFGPERTFIFAQDKEYRTFVICCKNYNEATRKRELLVEMLAILDDEYPSDPDPAMVA